MRRRRLNGPLLPPEGTGDGGDPPPALTPVTPWRNIFTTVAADEGALIETGVKLHSRPLARTHVTIKEVEAFGIGGVLPESTLANGRCAGTIVSPLSLRGVTLEDIARDGAVTLDLINPGRWSSRHQVQLEMQLQDDSIVSDLVTGSSVCHGVTFRFSMRQEDAQGDAVELATTEVDIFVQETDTVDIVL